MEEVRTTIEKLFDSFESKSKSLNGNAKRLNFGLNSDSKWRLLPSAGGSIAEQICELKPFSCQFQANENPTMMVHRLLSVVVTRTHQTFHRATSIRVFAAKTAVWMFRIYRNRVIGRCASSRLTSSRPRARYRSAPHCFLSDRFQWFQRFQFDFRSSNCKRR